MDTSFFAGWKHGARQSCVGIPPIVFGTGWFIAFEYAFACSAGSPLLCFHLGTSTKKKTSGSKSEWRCTASRSSRTRSSAIENWFCFAFYQRGFFHRQPYFSISSSPKHPSSFCCCCCWWWWCCVPPKTTRHGAVRSRNNPCRRLGCATIPDSPLPRLRVPRVPAAEAKPPIPLLPATCRPRRLPP